MKREQPPRCCLVSKNGSLRLFATQARQRFRPRAVSPVSGFARKVRFETKKVRFETKKVHLGIKTGAALRVKTGKRE